ncbi:MAG TPA: hypothetical protein VGJ20_44105 [Xanthobacteraceae bacterium]|jgi:hypothetical protein
MRLLAAMLATTLLAACSAANTNSPSAAQRIISQNEFDALRAKLIVHWKPDPLIFSQPDQYIVVVRVHLDRDGRLSAPMEVVSEGSAPHYRAAAEAAKRAIELSQPFDMLSQSTYDAWEEMEINFDPAVEICSPAAVGWIRAHPEAAKAHQCPPHTLTSL